MIEINSNSLIEIDKPFKVFAGPGAGKTFWLINHTKNVLRNSKKLSSTAKIACITYTNIGVDEIQKRLENNGDRVYVSTIHNFLYKFIVKPYAFLLKDNEGNYIINLKNLDGHDEHIPNNKFIFKWKSLNNIGYIKEDERIYECLQNLDWSLNETNELDLNPRDIWRKKVGKYSIKSDYFYSYKQLYWHNGQIHHEDVLYFSYRIITEHPEIIKFIHLKFPYIFIDEFQDTNPLQTQIIKKIANSGTIIGVIGDSEQSIYKFQGAKRQDFLDFDLPNLEIYQINGNRRSTKAIIKLLDNLRNDKIAQTSIRQIEGVSPTIYSDNRLQVIQKLQISHPDLVILSRKNETVGQIKNSNNRVLGDLWTISRNLDSNFDRQRLLYNAIYAAELCLLGNYKDAARIASKIFYKFSNGNKINDTKKKELAISIIDYLISHKNNNLSKTILEFHNTLFENLSRNYQVTVGAKISKGAFKDFAQEKTYANLVQSLRIKDDTSNIKTIHKAKGAEFNNVLVVFDSSDELKYILESQKHQIDDDSRIYYVAFSRARDNLFLHVNEPISIENMNKLMLFGIKEGILTK